jgi:thiol:disulfide interchange protein DsbD
MDSLSILQSSLEAGSLVAYPVAFAGGLLASLTPCTYPLIPVTVAYIGSRAAVNKKQGFLLSMTYAMGIALVYALLGGIAAYSGRIFGLVATHPLTNLAVGFFLLVMALSMLDLFTLPLPDFLKGTGKKKHGGMASAFMFGLCSGMVISPCTAPVMGVLLLFVASRQNVIYGMSLLFVFACGMSTILLCVGIVAGLAARLPKPGLWLVMVKRGLAILMVGSGVYFIYQAVCLYL